MLPLSDDANQLLQSSNGALPGKRGKKNKGL